MHSAPQKPKALNSGMQRLTGVHAIRIFASVFGNKGIETVKRSYYNVYGKTHSNGEALGYLETAISGYAVEYSGDIELNAFRNAVKATKFKEIIPEVIAKSLTGDSEFVTEFISLLRS